jgi:glycosyltransferase involved in cell wall biosynthesis
VHVAEEDFGISMVEALAAGTPVVALARGGARDIVRDGEHGILVDRPDVEAIRRAVREVAARGWDAETLVAHAREFSRARFVDRFAAHVREVIAARS